MSQEQIRPRPSGGDDETGAAALLRADLLRPPAAPLEPAHGALCEDVVPPVPAQPLRGAVCPALHRHRLCEDSHSASLPVHC